MEIYKVNGYRDNKSFSGRVRIDSHIRTINVIDSSVRFYLFFKKQCILSFREDDSLYFHYNQNCCLDQFESVFLFQDKCSVITLTFSQVFAHTVNILNIGTERSDQTVQTRIRLLLLRSSLISVYTVCNYICNILMHFIAKLNCVITVTDRCPIFFDFMQTSLRFSQGFRP